MNKLAKEHKDYIIELWHTSIISVRDRHSRLLYVRDNFLKKYPEYNSKHKTVWFFIIDTLN